MSKRELVDRQKQPEPNDSRPIWDLVIEDMRERDHIGRERYGTPLQAHNGRDAMVDAYQEALDLVAYLRQVIEERSGLRTRLERLMKVIAILENDVAEVTSERDELKRVTERATSINERLKQERDAARENTRLHMIERDQAIAETAEQCARICERNLGIASSDWRSACDSCAREIRFAHVAQREQESVEDGLGLSPSRGMVRDENCTVSPRHDADQSSADPKGREAVECDHCSAEGTSQLPARILAMCKARGWGLHWTHRGAYLHLEASELIEAIRGKHGDPKEEAGDVLLVLMSITEANGISWDDVVASAGTKVDKLMSDLAPYPGEERGE